MNSIIIKDLEIFACHGVLNEEKNIKQKFLVSVQLNSDFWNYNDDIKNAVNYSETCDCIVDFVTTNCFNLIETCAEQLAEYLLQKYQQLTSVDVTIKKPWAPLNKNLSFVAASTHKNWYIAFIGIGSNLGDSYDNIKQALKLINTKNTYVLKTSQIYETSPISNIPQNNYLNCVAQIKTLLTPTQLMQFLLGIEQELKRVRTVKNAPRTIDLDILLFNNCVFNTELVTIPHPRMHERLFVLIPLCELAPDYVHPILNQTIYNLSKQLQKTQQLLKP